MSGSKLRSRHPHPLDDRDRALEQSRRDLNDAVSKLPTLTNNDLDAPLPDSRDAEREARHWADVRERLERLLRDPDLSERTQGIIESFDEQLTNRGFLTGNQVNTIIEIEDRRDSGKRRY